MGRGSLNANLILYTTTDAELRFRFVKQTLTPPKTNAQPVVPVYNCVLMRTMTAVTLVTAGGEGDGEVGDV